MNKTCIIIAGPTAVGKTGVAVEIAKHFAAEIISSDSRQCYKELNIGVAKPSPQQLASVPHYFINSHSIHDNVTAAGFEAYALETAGKLFAHSDKVVMVGGTGLYTKAFCEGLDEIPVASESFREELKNKYGQNGFTWLEKEVAQKDPQFYAKGEMQNPHRMMRALEVMHVSARSILSYYTNEKKKRDFDTIKIGLELSREELYQNINERTEQMMGAGLLDEAKGLIEWRHLNPLQTVGYRELFSFLDGGLPLQNAVELIKQNTRNYAKRQMTWFKKDLEFTWVKPNETEKLISLINEKFRVNGEW